MLSDALAAQPEALDEVTSTVSMGRLGRPEELAKTVTFLEFPTTPASSPATRSSSTEAVPRSNPHVARRGKEGLSNRHLAGSRNAWATHHASRDAWPTHTRVGQADARPGD
jgi:hypothetical protein